ncbi:MULTISPECIES: class I SAM-dependent methyltransferase [unclassified Luteimonas]|uniref:class I SAM-dependent methyltransferase n=1 Tax=unclassified Luteimonas TaxID=2629088 RepID=UPI0018F08C61|nr:class I SAM-dependent methyltransferase [Luteimonas sp. MC1750]MBJ6978559.1 class I SAM-dependent methyltransferase [Luteimonas sp. MC1895]MBJ6983456.1 class I SAM-dependent methyltransferase [Luteimonas sp. MC1750]QQO06308.1 class I SAM-dependent methyltransferase [Luteimonas sp. MC1750]
MTGVQPWHLCCTACTYEGSTLEPHILEQAAGGDLDEAARHDGLQALRRANFARLLQRLGTLPVPVRTLRPRLLDVGCAHGWFIEAAGAGFDTVGIEPDASVAAAARARGLAVRSGFFPDVLGADERFDLIVFNDVLEHIPDVNATLAAVSRHLSHGGWLIVNSPSRRGFLYRLSKMMARLHLARTFERMWQLGFPSPHVHYFDTAVMRALAARHGFELAETMVLPSVAIRGLYSRIRYSRDVPVAKAALLAGAVTVATPLLAVLPPDIEVWLLRKP